MTYEDVFKFTYASWFITTMKVMAENTGEEPFIELLKRAASETARRLVARGEKSRSDDSLAAFARIFENPNPILKNGATYEIVENTDKALELNVTECLWARVFRDADAAGIGYAYICFPDYAVAQAFNPKIVLNRSKTLMQGDSSCNHRYELKA